MSNLPPEGVQLVVLGLVMVLLIMAGAPAKAAGDDE